MSNEASPAAETPTQPQPEPIRSQSAPAEQPLSEDAELLQELVNSAVARAAMYRLVVTFAARKPEGQVIGALKGSIDPAASMGEGLMAEGFRDVAAYLENLDTATILDLLVDYGLAIENRPSGVTGAGMELARDYLGSACDSLALICQRQADALCAGNLDEALKLLRVQQSMYATRLEQWAETYCDQLEPEVVTQFYKGGIKFVRGFVREEKLYIEDSAAAVEELLEHARTA